MPFDKRYVAPLIFAGLFASTLLIGFVVLAVALGSDGADSGRMTERPSYAGNPTPPALVGTWSSSSTSTINYRDRATGTFAPPSGSIFSYKIADNGTYEFSGYLQSTLYHCTIVLFRWQRGTIAVSGERMTLTPREGRMYYKDSCRAGSEKEQKAVDERQEYSFKHETENNHTLIVMTKANGEHWGKFYRR